MRRILVGLGVVCGVLLLLLLRDRPSRASTDEQASLLSSGGDDRDSAARRRPGLMVPRQDLSHALASAAPPPAPAPQPRERVRVRILDIVTRKPLVGVRVPVARAGSAESDAGPATDESGFVEVRRDDLDKIHLRSDDWRLLRATAADLRGPRITLYAYRMIRVNVACTFAAAFPGAAPVVPPKPGTVVEVQVRRPLDVARTVGPASMSVGGQQWLTERGASRDSYATALTSAHAITFRTRFFPDQGFVLSAPGFWSDFVKIPSDGPFGNGNPEVNLNVVLHAGYRISGSLHAEDGKPLANRRISLIVFRRIPVRDATVAKCKLPGTGLSMRWGNNDEFARVQTHTVVTTGPDGTYTISSAVDGEPLLFVHEPGFLPGLARAGSMRDIGDRANIVLRRTRGRPRVRLTWRGTPLDPGPLMVVTMSGDPQYNFDTHVGEDGEVPAEWFQAGVDYFIRYVPREVKGGLRGEARGVFHWHGQSELRLEDLQHANVHLQRAAASRR